MKVPVYSAKGKKKNEIELPKVFETGYRPDLIRRAVLAGVSERAQPYGSDPLAGKRTSAESLGTGSGVSRTKRIKAGPMRLGRGARKYRSKFRSFHAALRGAFAPGTVGGRRAHPPLPVDKTKKINKKEKELAMKSAIAATGNRDNVALRGHRIEKVKDIPLVVDDEFAKAEKTDEVVENLESLGLGDDIERCRTRKIRAGRGKMRGRKYRRRTGPLIVSEGRFKAASNIPGVDAVAVNSLNVEALSPGAHGARLVLWTEGAMKKLGERHK